MTIRNTMFPRTIQQHINFYVIVQTFRGHHFKVTIYQNISCRGYPKRHHSKPCRGDPRMYYSKQWLISRDAPFYTLKGTYPECIILNLFLPPPPQQNGNLSLKMLPSQIVNGKLFADAIKY